MNKQAMDELCGTMQSITVKYDHQSAEYKAAELATKALLYIYMNDQFDTFLQEIADWSEPAA